MDKKGRGAWNLRNNHAELAILIVAETSGQGSESVLIDLSERGSIMGQPPQAESRVEKGKELTKMADFSYPAFSFHTMLFLPSFHSGITNMNWVFSISIQVSIILLYLYISICTIEYYLVWKLLELFTKYLEWLSPQSTW